MTLDFNEYRYRYWGKTIHLLVIACCLGSIFWVIKDTFISEGSRLFCSILCRGLPCLFYIIYFKFNNKNNFILLATLHIWLSIFGVFILYFLDPTLKTSGLGWQMYICLLFVACNASNIIISIINFMSINTLLVFLYKIFPDKLTISVGEFYFSNGIITLAMIIVCYYISKLFMEAFSLNVKLEKKSFIDPLTGLYNRYIIDNISENNLLKDNGTLLIIDIDKFKKINDTYGHNIGDKCLILTANALLHVFNDNNSYIIRYGGDEFVVLIPNKVFMNETHSKILDYLNSNKTTLDITLSIGVTYVYAGENIYDCIKRADVALYEVKGQGRNNYLKFEDLDIGINDIDNH